MPMRRDDLGQPINLPNGISIHQTDEGIVIGNGAEAILVRGANLALEDHFNWVRGTYPDNYPFSAPHMHPEEDVYINFALDPAFPPDGIPLDRLPRVIREFKRAFNTGGIHVKTDLDPSIKNGDLVVWDNTKQKFVLATCTGSRANIAANIFFTGVADTDAGSVITNSSATIKDWNLIPKAKYFLDCSRPGKLTTTDTGYFVGIAQDKHTLYLAPFANSVEKLLTMLEIKLQEAIDDYNAKITALSNRLTAVDQALRALIAQTRKDLEDMIAALKKSLNDGDALLLENGVYNLNCATVLKCFQKYLVPDSGIIVEGNKIYVDFSTVSPERLLELLSVIIKPNGGLTIENGRLKLDLTTGFGIQVTNDRHITLIPNTATGIKIDRDGIGLDLIAGNGITITGRTIELNVIEREGLSFKNGALYFDIASLSLTQMLALANRLKGPGLNTTTDGKLTVDFDTFSTDELIALIKKLIQTGGGLDVDDTGKIFVNFEIMPTDKFEKLLKSIRVPIWLNGAKTFYVNQATGSDTLDDKRGESASKPFRTIQACVEYVCSNYNFSKYDATIIIYPGTYKEDANLPAFSSTTGRLVLRPSTMNASRPVIIEGKTPSFVVQATGAKDYVLEHLHIRLALTSSDVSRSVWPRVLSAEQNAKLHLYGVKLELTAATTSLGAGVVVNPAIMGAAGGVVNIYSDPYLPMEIAAPTSIASPDQFSIYMMQALSGGLIDFKSYVDNSPNTVVNCSGAYGIVANAANKGTIQIGDVGDNKFNFVGACTGIHYYCVSGGAVNMQGLGPNYLPGSIAGFVEDSTFSWYK